MHIDLKEYDGRPGRAAAQVRLEHQNRYFCNIAIKSNNREKNFLILIWSDVYIFVCKCLSKVVVHVP